jgi:hypothetical protein
MKKEQRIAKIKEMMMYTREENMVTELRYANTPEEWLFNPEGILNDGINDKNDNYTALAVWFI